MLVLHIRTYRGEEHFLQAAPSAASASVDTGTEEEALAKLREFLHDEVDHRGWLLLSSDLDC